MTLDPSQLSQSRDLLREALETARELEGQLSAGAGTRRNERPPGRAQLALMGLVESRIWFGNPVANFWKLPSKGQSGFELYLLKVPLALQPARGAQYSRIECQLELESEHAPDIVSVFPAHHFSEQLRVEGEFDLGVDENLELRLNSGRVELGPNGAQAQAKVDGKGRLQTTARFSWEFGDMKVAATGAGNRAFWRIDDAKLTRQGKVDFGVLFKLPAQAQRFRAEGLAAAYPDMNWLGGRLGDIWEFLSEKLKALLRPSGGEDSLPLGQNESWELDCGAASLVPKPNG